MSQQNSRTGIVTGILLILLGAAFLVLQFVDLGLPSGWWPAGIILVGVLFFLAMLVPGRAGSPLAIPGSIIIMVGLILLFQTRFGLWEAWAYAWTLIIFAAGIGISIHGRYSRQDKVRQSGGLVARLGLVLFVIFGIFFELVIGISGLFDGSSILWPLLLILFGFYQLLARAGLFSALMPRRRPAQPAPTSAPAVTEPPLPAMPFEPDAGSLPTEPEPIELPADSSKLVNDYSFPKPIEPEPFVPPFYPTGDPDDEERRASDRSM